MTLMAGTLARTAMRAPSCLVSALLVALATPAWGLEVSGGVSLGGLAVGTAPRFAVSPHVGVAGRREGGLRFAAHDLCSILPAGGKLGVGVYNQTSVSIGYATKDVDVNLGPSLSVYSMTACGATLCGQVVGLSPGGHAQANVYFLGPLGVSVRANVDWVGGQSLVLPGGLAAMIVAGPVFRWELK
jgi:hypothetical protein